LQTNHSFHIPVLGVGYSVDTPVKVAKYGISSVISLVDDQLAEDLREYYCHQRGEPFEPITDDDEDPRARRFTAYLNLVGTMVRESTEQVRNAPFTGESEIDTYCRLQPDDSPVRATYNAMQNAADPQERERLQQELREAIQPGSVDVNIMVKVDRDRYRNGEKLPPEYADAMSALRGYAQSELESSIVLSAGFNRRLTKYMEQFDDFQADENGEFRKKIVLKVSDFRSAFTQAKMFARGGLWISEYRVESGLNCGGHTFDGDGSLIGPILEEFSSRRDELAETAYAGYSEAVRKRTGSAPPQPALSITAQGGVGTAAEHSFLMHHYDLDAVGWGSSFLLVPDAVNLDPETLNKLAAAGENDIVSSGASPLGVRFSNLVNSAAELFKHRRSREGKPGSSCPKGYLKFNSEFTEHAICVASRQYQERKLRELETLDLEPVERRLRREEIIEPACLCRDLSGTVERNYGTGRYKEGATPAVCPGPNLAFFGSVATLQQMVDHIYGRLNLITRSDRPHMFVNELKLCVGSLMRELRQAARGRGSRNADELRKYRDNLIAGIEYYRGLLGSLGSAYAEWKAAIPGELATVRQQIMQLSASEPALATPSA